MSSVDGADLITELPVPDSMDQQLVCCAAI